MSWSFKELSTIQKALVDPVVFAEDPFFLGLNLYDKQKEVMRQFYAGNPNGTPYRELVMMLGRQSGKTFLTSIFALYEAFMLLILEDPAVHYDLAPGSKIFILCVAVSETQARDTIYSQITAKITRSPFFKRMNPKIYSLEIRFERKGIYIFCGTSSSASMVGRTVKLLIIDEIAKFEESSSKRGAWNVYNSLARSTVLFGNAGKRIIISSPMHSDDVIVQLIERTKMYDDMLGLVYPTWEFNPKISFDSPEMQRELAKDPISFWTDYGVRPLSITEFYFGNRDILRVEETKTNLLDVYFSKATMAVPPYMYVLAGDPALKHDAFGLGIGHVELDEYHIDGLWALKSLVGSELDPLQVTDHILGIIDTFKPLITVFDTWAFPEMQERIRRKGVPVLQNIVVKDNYDKVKELFYQRHLHVCNYPFVIDELKNLRLIRGKKVDHPKGGSKDVADALANVIWGLETSLAMPTRPLITGLVV